jgi:EAL domain-containing protein (putative c-di-GMP-specific phosphodiesterase class I)
MSQADNFEEELHTPYLRQFEIIYDSGTLIEKAKTHDLVLDAIVEQAFAVDLTSLESLYNHLNDAEKNSFLEALMVAVATWPSHSNMEDFTQRINDCIEHWVTAASNGTRIMTLLSLLKCILVAAESPQTATLNNAWAHFLMDLLSETIFTHQTQQIHYLLDHDAITNLPNTNLLIKDVNEKTAESTNTPLSLFTIRFLIERGTIATSPILPASLNSSIAMLLETCFTVPHTLYQCSNLLFSVVIEKTFNNTQLSMQIAKIQHRFDQIINIDQQSFLVSPVIGVVAEINQPSSAHLYYNQARTALSNALMHKKHYVVYTKSISDDVEKQKKLELDVTSAFNNEELELYLQPIVGLPKRQCVGAEVLLRWPNAATKGIYPNVVVEIINKVGLGKLFTRWLIQSVCRLASELKTNHGLNIYLTLNLRAEDLYDAELPHLIQQSAQFWKINPTDIILEITENGILEENETTLNTIRIITENGFKLALDDFGTGYSSMARLRTLPISLIKIDQSFVRNIALSKEDFEIVQSMSSLANSLKKEVLVEGVETEAGLVLINQIGIGKAQGYLFSKPMPFDAFVDWAKKNAGN